MDCMKVAIGPLCTGSTQVAPVAEGNYPLCGAGLELKERHIKVNHTLHSPLLFLIKIQQTLNQPPQIHPNMSEASTIVLSVKHQAIYDKSQNTLAVQTREYASTAGAPWLSVSPSSQDNWKTGRPLRSSDGKSLSIKASDQTVFGTTGVEAHTSAATDLNLSVDHLILHRVSVTPNDLVLQMMLEKMPSGTASGPFIYHFRSDDGEQEDEQEDSVTVPPTNKDEEVEVDAVELAKSFFS
jgi:hypothetical protein